MLFNWVSPQNDQETTNCFNNIIWNCQTPAFTSAIQLKNSEIDNS